jgi:hypothetical protein
LIEARAVGEFSSEEKTSALDAENSGRRHAWREREVKSDPAPEDEGRGTPLLGICIIRTNDRVDTETDAVAGTVVPGWVPANRDSAL